MKEITNGILALQNWEHDINIAFQAIESQFPLTGSDYIASYERIFTQTHKQ